VIFGRNIVKKNTILFENPQYNIVKQHRSRDQTVQVGVSGLDFFIHFNPWTTVFQKGKLLTMDKPMDFLGTASCCSSLWF